MRNVLGENEVFEGSIAYGSVENFAHFVGVTNGIYNRFQVDYLDGEIVLLAGRKLLNTHDYACFTRNAGYI